MKRFKLANILLDGSRQFFESPCLFCRSNAPILPKEDCNAARLMGPGSFDFLTYFNSLSIQKYLEYTVVRDVFLHIEVKGSAAHFTQSFGRARDFHPHLVDDATMELPHADDWTAYDIKLSTNNKAVLIGFLLETEGETLIRNAYYYANVPENDIHTVELAVSTTTFKKESFILHNIDLVRNSILDSDEDLSKHFRMFVIDNGRTLNLEACSDNRITIYPNMNVGGSGGFAYGMLLAMEQEEVTHLLLMDDDVEISPESYIRTYALLSLVKENYSDAFLSGAMLDYDSPDKQWEDVGYITEVGVCRSVKPMRNMSSLHEVIENESLVESGGFRDVLTRRYASWWYCCIPMTQIRQNGLPLPLFVRFDDIEYSQRCSPTIMTMNGICVWHLGFQMRYNEAVERYQTTRNSLVGQLTTNTSKGANYIAEITHSMRLELIKFNYEGAELLLSGLEDFLKGPGCYSAPGFAEQSFIAANQKKEKLYPLSEIKDEVFSLTGKDILSLSSSEIIEDIPYTGRSRGPIFDMGYRRIVRNSLNGQLWGSITPAQGDTAIIEAYGWVYPVGKIAGVNHIVVIDIPNHRGAIRHKNPHLCRELWKRFQDDIGILKRTHKQLAKEYSESREVVTGISFWQKYLRKADL